MTRVNLLLFVRSRSPSPRCSPSTSVFCFACTVLLHLLARFPAPADVSDTGCATVAVAVPPADIICFVPSPDLVSGTGSRHW